LTGKQAIPGANPQLAIREITQHCVRAASDGEHCREHVTNQQAPVCIVCGVKTGRSRPRGMRAKLRAAACLA